METHPVHAENGWRSTSIISISCGLLLSACSMFVDGKEILSEGRALQTDRQEYEAELSDEGYRKVLIEIPMTYTNVTAEIVYLIGCRHPSMPVLQKFEAGKWIVAYSGVELMCLSPPWALDPGEVFRDTLSVRGHLPGQNAAPIFDTEVAGLYRLKRAVYSDLEGEAMLPESLLVSNLFEVREK